MRSQAVSASACSSSCATTRIRTVARVPFNGSRCARAHQRLTNAAGPASAHTAVEGLSRELVADEASAWEASCSHVCDRLDVSADEGNRLLARAFGWASQAYWRREKIEQVPSVDQVEAALDYLTGTLELVGDDLVKVVKAFPEVLACDVEARLAANVQTLERQWRLSGSTLTKAIVRQPQVLGYSVDCGGDCIGECNRCWARF